MQEAADGICSRILELDVGIGFAGIANNEGKLIGHALRRGLLPTLTRREGEVATLQSLIQARSNAGLEKKLGNAIFSYTLYPRAKRVTIPLRSKSGDPFIVMVSFDVSVNHESIILEKILPLLCEKDP